MKKGIRAVLNHCTNLPDKMRRHILCPRVLNSWCRWKNCEVNIPMWTYDVIKKDFDDLSDDFLLKNAFMERHKIVMKVLITKYGLDVQKIFLLQDFCLKWVFVLQLFTYGHITDIRF